MNTSAKGRNFEHEVQHIFEDAGFSVTRGAGSKGHFFTCKVDLIASKETVLNERRVYITVVGAQCKVRRK